MRPMRSAYGKIVWSWRPQAGVKSLRRCGGQPVRTSISRKATGAIVPRSPRRARHKPSTYCAGKPGCPGYTCMPLFRFLIPTSHSGPRVRAGSWPSLRLLSIEGEEIEQGSGKCAARMRGCVCDENWRAGLWLCAPTQRSTPGDAKHRPARCAAEPGSMLQRARRLPGSRLCAATLARCSASGTRKARNPDERSDTRGPL